MSRGHGRMERAILDALPETTPCTAESLRYATGYQLLIVGKSTGDDHSFRMSFNRALRNLESAGKVKRTMIARKEAKPALESPAWCRADLAKRRRQVAYHEAGHAVIGHVLKRGVEFATIQPDRTYLGVVKHGKGRGRDHLSDILFTMAGEIAEAKVAGRPLNWKNDGPRGDWRDIQRLRRTIRFYKGKVDAWGNFEARTRLLVEKHWPAIKAVADELMKREMILRSEIARLCEANGSKFETFEDQPERR
jgi:hypothetical protein